jgi:hypothetical protein
MMSLTLTPREWFKKKSSEYKNLTGEVWVFKEAQDCYETLMRMAVEKRFFGLTSYQEDLEIANAVMIRDIIRYQHEPKEDNL